MPGKREKVDPAEFPGQVDRQFRHRLRRVGVEDDPRIDLFDQTHEPLDREDDAGFVVGVHDRDQERLARRERAGEFGDIEVPGGVDRNLDDGVSAPPEFAADFQHRGMLDLRGDDSAAFRVRGRRAADRSVVTSGGARGEEDLVGPAAEMTGDRRARRAERLLYLFGRFVEGTRIKILRFQIRTHGVDDFRRDSGGGVVIDIDHVKLSMGALGGAFSGRVLR